MVKFVEQPKIFDACSRPGSVAALKKLLAQGADPNARSSAGWTAAMVLAKDGDAKRLAALLDAGADLDAKCDTNYTAAMFAADGGHLGCLRLLVERGCDLEARDKWGTVMSGRTAAIVAAAEGRPECLKFLLESGADADARDDNGRGIEDWARKADDAERGAECERVVGEFKALREAESLRASIGKGAASAPKGKSAKPL